jgi:nucleotide-binding universal stress UspA family protein
MGTESKDQVTQSQEMHQEIGNDKQCQSANLQLGGRGRDEQRLICIPCSLTTASMHIVEWANSTILTNSDRVVLVAVRAKTAPSIGQTLPRNVVDVKQVHTIKEDEKVEEILKKFMTLIPGIQTEVEVLHGDYRTEVVKYVNAIKPNLCIVGEEHKSGFQKVFKGSTSEYLVHHLRVPVVVLPVGET